MCQIENPAFGRGLLWPAATRNKDVNTVEIAAPSNYIPGEVHTDFGEICSHVLVSLVRIMRADETKDPGNERIGKSIIILKYNILSLSCFF